MIIRRYIEVFGMVQCVGFRFFADRSAAGLGLSGWVRNRDDGAVEMEIQGDGASVEAFIGAVSQGPRYARVERISVRERPVEEGEGAFHVRDAWI